ncbi:hypothetical protein LINGRAHAP2_LOCUS17861 [Linum grandiflorum]
MAANGARRVIRCSSTKTLFSGASSVKRGASSPSASKASSFTPTLSPSKPSFRRPTLSRMAICRFPVELGGALSMMPLHSATSSALFTSLLSLHSQSWGCLSEGTLLSLMSLNAALHVQYVYVNK